MRHTIKAAVTGIAVTAVTVAGTLAATETAGAATGILVVGSAGGSYVRALNSTVTSDVTALSGVNTLSSSATSTNTAASAVVSGVAAVGAISTSVKVTPIRNSSNAVIGKQMVSEVKTANVNLLGGSITIGAIDTVNIVKIVNGVAFASANTTFTAVHAAGLTVPVVIPQNFAISLPGIATVVINQSITGAVGGTAEAIGNGVSIRLLKATGSTPAGSTVVVASTFGALVNFSAPNTGHSIGGTAYGTKVHAAVGTLADVRSDPTAPVYVPLAGTPTGPKVSSIAAVNLAPTLQIGAITDTASGTNTTALGFAHTTSKIASINLLGGLIKAGAITADAHASAPTSAATSVGGTSQLANLVINGHPITISTSPNQVITIAGLATITINQQLATPFTVTVRALDITLLAAVGGLPAGAEIQIATATAGAV